MCQVQVPKNGTRVGLESKSLTRVLHLWIILTSHELNHFVQLPVQRRIHYKLATLTYRTIPKRSDFSSHLGEQNAVAVGVS